jgi:hypothetical protein
MTPLKDILIAATVFAIAPSVFAAKEFVDAKIGGKTVNVVKVTLDATTRIVTPYADEGGETFENLLKKAGSDTGINGAYFCPADYSWCGKTYTNADRAYEGTQNFKFGGDFGAKGFFGFDTDDKPLFVLDNVWYGKGIDRSYNASRKKDIKNGISNIPVLLLEGENVLAESESELDAKMKASSAKSFICSDESGNVVHFGTVTPATVYEMPDFLKRNFGCYHAVGLDNGGSMGLSYAGKTIRKPGRKIMDAFAVVDVADSVRKEDAEISRQASKIAAVLAVKIRAMKKSGMNSASVADKIASIRDRIRLLAKPSGTTKGDIREAKIWKKVLESPVLKNR